MESLSNITERIEIMQNKNVDWGVLHEYKQSFQALLISKHVDHSQTLYQGLLVCISTFEEITRDVNSILSICVELYNTPTKMAYERDTEDSSIGDYINALVVIKDDCCCELFIKQSILKLICANSQKMKELSYAWKVNVFVEPEKYQPMLQQATFKRPFYEEL